MGKNIFNLFSRFAKGFLIGIGLTTTTIILSSMLFGKTKIDVLLGVSTTKTKFVFGQIVKINSSFYKSCPAQVRSIVSYSPEIYEMWLDCAYLNLLGNIAVNSLVINLSAEEMEAL
jgi:hypothetical protein